MISFIDSELGDSAPFSLTCLSSRSYSSASPEEYTPYEETYLTGWHGFARLAMKAPWTWALSRKALPAGNEQHQFGTR